MTSDPLPAGAQVASQAAREGIVRMLGEVVRHNAEPTLATLLFRSGHIMTGALMDYEGGLFSFAEVAHTGPDNRRKYHMDMWLDPSEIVGVRWEE